MRRGPSSSTKDEVEVEEADEQAERGGGDVHANDAAEVEDGAVSKPSKNDRDAFDESGVGGTGEMDVVMDVVEVAVPAGPSSTAPPRLAFPLPLPPPPPRLNLTR